MIASTQLYRPILSHLSQHAHYVDKRHMKALALMDSVPLQCESFFALADCIARIWPFER